MRRSVLTPRVDNGAFCTKPKFIYDPQFLFSIIESFRSFEYKTKVLAYLNPSNAFKFPPYLKKK
ncbi:hypothetical protein JMJ77_0014574, partial [Colletotrichum scovillei]